MASHLTGGQFFGQVASRREAGGVVLSEVVHRQPRALPHHVHQRTYLCLLLGGSYGEEIGRKPVRHRQLSLTLRPGGVEHRDWIGRGGGRFFMAELAPELTGEGERDPAFLTDADALGAMLRLYREFRTWDVCSPAVTEELIAALLEQGEEPPAERPAWLRRAAEWVYDHDGVNVPLAELARDAGVHPGHLARTFRRFCGRSPAELSRQLRVRRVCEGLAAGDRPLAQVALDAGFADQAHMTRSLTRWVGMTPGALRRLLRGHGANGTPVGSEV